MDIATRVEVQHCQHCHPTWDWIENQEGKPPQGVFTGFPMHGAILLSKKTVVVFCGRCALPEDILKRAC